MELTIRPLRTDDQEDVEAAYRVVRDVLAHDIPDFPPVSRTDYVGGMAHPWPGQEVHRFLGTVGSEVVANLMVELPQLDNLRMAYLELAVHPDHRRRGFGRALYEHAAEFTRSAGRSNLKGDYVTQLPGGAPRDPGFASFAAAMGVKPALDEVRRELDITTVDRTMWTEQLAAARERAAGYRIVVWGDRTPDEFVDDVAMLDGRLLLDSPQGELDLEPENVDRDRIRAGEEVIRQRGRRVYHVGAVHEASGRLAGWTTIGFDADQQEYAWQQITIVDPAHRGHRLGMLVKAENLLRVIEQEPRLRVLNTWNAAANSYMIAINEALGFRAVDAFVAWQQEL